MLEKEIEKKCKAIAKKAGWISYKFTSPQQRGVPDQLFIRAGVVIFVEFKREGEKPSKLQIKTINEMRAKGVTVFVVDSVEKFLKDFPLC